ncbi:MAG: hypothetical protein WCB01_01580 [Candidatus Cybelea sp.]
MALREARDGLALLMKTAGMLAPDAAVNVTIDARRQVMANLAKLSEDDVRAIAAGKPIALPAAESGTAFRDSADLISP